MATHVRQPQTDYSYLCDGGFLNSLAFSAQVSLDFQCYILDILCLQISVFHKAGILKVLSTPMTSYSPTYVYIFLMFKIKCVIAILMALLAP